MTLLQWLPPIVIGIAIVFLCTPRAENVFQILFRFGLGAGLGFGITSTLFFAWMAFVPWPFSTYFIVESALATLLAISLMAKLHLSSPAPNPAISSPAPKGSSIAILRLIFITLAVLAGLWFAGDSYRHPHGDWDAWAIWNLRARFLFRTGADWQALYETLLDWTHPDYPLLLPGIVLRAWTISGSESTFFPAATAELFTFATLVFLTSFISVLKGEKQGYLAGFVLLGTGFFLRHGASQFADIELAFFLLSSIALFYWYDLEGCVNPGIVMLAGLTAGCALWSKNEGALFVIVISSIRLFLAWRHGNWASYLRETAWFWLSLLPFAAMLLSFKLTIAPQNDVINPATLSTVADRLLDLSRYVKVAGEYALHFLAFGNGIVIVLSVYIYLSTRQLRLRLDWTLITPTGTVVLMLAGYFCVYVITPHDLDWHIRTSLDRLIFQLWPAIVMLVFLCLTPRQTPSSTG